MAKRNRQSAKVHAPSHDMITKPSRMMLSKDSVKSVARSAYAHKTGILSTLLGGALMFYGYRKKSAIAHLARVVGASLFGRGAMRVPSRSY